MSAAVRRKIYDQRVNPNPNRGYRNPGGRRIGRLGPLLACTLQTLKGGIIHWGENYNQEEMGECYSSRNRSKFGWQNRLSFNTRLKEAARGIPDRFNSRELPAENRPSILRYRMRAGRPAPTIGLLCIQCDVVAAGVPARRGLFHKCHQFLVHETTLSPGW